MRLYREFSQYATGSVRTAVNPTLVQAATYTLAGALVENLAPVNDGAVGRYRADTADALYTTATAYRVAWTCTIGGVTFTRTVRYTHVTQGTTDVTGPGAPQIGAPLVTPTSATFPHVPPTDADYDHTTIYLITATGVVSAQGSGSYITVPALSPGMTYPLALAIAFDTSGNPSLPAVGSWTGAFTTLPEGMPAHPIIVKFYFGNRATMSAGAPRYANADRVGTFSFGSPLAPLGRGPNMRIRLEVHHPIWPKIAAIVVHGQTHEDSAGGVGDKARVNNGG